MLNQVVIVGRLVDEVKKIKTEEGKEVSYITLAVSRPYKNADGEYETDFIRCVLWDGIAENTINCKKGDIIGVKGRLQSSSYTDENGKKQYLTDVIAERVTFLSSKKSDDKTEEKENDEVKDGKETSEEA